MRAVRWLRVRHSRCGCCACWARPRVTSISPPPSCPSHQDPRRSGGPLSCQLAYAVACPCARMVVLGSSRARPRPATHTRQLACANARGEVSAGGRGPRCGGKKIDDLFFLPPSASPPRFCAAFIAPEAQQSARAGRPGYIDPGVASTSNETTQVFGLCTFPPRVPTRIDPISYARE